VRYLLLDRIEEFEPGRAIRGWKSVAMSEDYLAWHFPEQPILPGVLVIEAFVQLAGWLAAASSDFSRWFLLEEVARARFLAFAVPGDRVDLALRVVAEEPGRLRLEGESTVAGARAGSVEIAGRLVPLSDLEAPEAARRTFRALRRETP